MLNKEMSAGTNAEQSTNDETRLPSSPTCGNTIVVRSPNFVSTEKEDEEPKSPIEILRQMCQRDEDGFLILTPDIDIDAIVKSTGAIGFTSPKIESQNEILNKGNQEQ